MHVANPTHTLFPHFDVHGMLTGMVKRAREARHPQPQDRMQKKGTNCDASPTLTTPTTLYHTATTSYYMPENQATTIFLFPAIFSNFLENSKKLSVDLKKHYHTTPHLTTS